MLKALFRRLIDIKQYVIACWLDTNYNKVGTDIW